MDKNWWKESVVYQIYPRSFKDSNGDGIGDLKGVIEKLDYLKDLGIDAIWLSPVYKSPNDDNGYDISDYKDIMDEFGTMSDFDLLLSEAHKRNIRIIMDLVVNHTSDEHKWFAESRKSIDNKYRDYYIWRKGKENQPPNNWTSFFEGSAWQYDKTTDMYYLHLFSKKQPDLNWENEHVRNEIYSMVKWWLDKGIDGFRMDAINLISKDLSFPESKEKGQKTGCNALPYVINRPRVHEFLRELNDRVFSKYDIMTVGETSCVDTKEALKYVGKDRHEINMLFQFEHVTLGKYGPWDTLSFKLTDLKEIMSKWQKDLEGKGWTGLYWDNHDQPRAVSRFGNDKKYWRESAEMLATCLHMMQGTPYIYQGEEIGMTNAYFDSIDDYRDVETLNTYNEFVNLQGKDPEYVMKGIKLRSRDNARTPMQWDDSKNAGFTTGIPWIRVNDNYKKINAKNQIEDKNSILNYYKKLIKIRKKYPVVVYGKYELLLKDDEKIYAYTRTFNEEEILVICNFSSECPSFCLRGFVQHSIGKLLISNYDVKDSSITNFNMKPYEARVYLLK